MLRITERDLRENTDALDFDKSSKLLRYYIRHTYEKIIMENLINNTTTDSDKLNELIENSSLSVILMNIEFIKRTVSFFNYKPKYLEYVRDNGLMVNGIYLTGKISYDGENIKPIEQTVILSRCDDINVVYIDFDMKVFLDSYFKYIPYKNLDLSKPLFKHCHNIRQLIEFSNNNDKCIKNISVLVESNPSPSNDDLQNKYIGIRGAQELPHIPRKSIFNDHKDKKLVHSISNLLNQNINLVHYMLIYDVEIRDIPICKYIIYMSISKEQYNVPQIIDYYINDNTDSLKSNLDFNVFFKIYNILFTKEKFLREKKEILETDKYIELERMADGFSEIICNLKPIPDHEKFIENFKEEYKFIFQEWFNLADKEDINNIFVGPIKYLISFDNIKCSHLLFSKQNAYFEIKLPIEFYKIFFDYFPNNHTVVGIEMQINRLLIRHRMKYAFDRLKKRQYIVNVLKHWALVKENKKAVFKSWLLVRKNNGFINKYWNILKNLVQCKKNQQLLLMSLLEDSNDSSKSSSSTPSNKKKSRKSKKNKKQVKNNIDDKSNNQIDIMVTSIDESINDEQEIMEDDLSGFEFQKSRKNTSPPVNKKNKKKKKILQKPTIVEQPVVNKCNDDFPVLQKKINTEDYYNDFKNIIQSIINLSVDDSIHNKKYSQLRKKFDRINQQIIVTSWRLFSTTSKDARMSANQYIQEQQNAMYNTMYQQQYLPQQYVPEQGFLDFNGIFHPINSGYQGPGHLVQGFIDVNGFFHMENPTHIVQVMQT